MSESNTAAAAESAVQYVANKNGVRIGDAVYNKGETVPMIEGRNYERAVSQGVLSRIGLAPGAAPFTSAMLSNLGGSGDRPAPARQHDRTDIPQGAERVSIAPVLKGQKAYWVGNDGAFAPVMVQDIAPIDAEAAEGLGLTPGQLAPKVLLEGETEPEFVTPESLLPELPTARLIAEIFAENAPEDGEDGEGALFSGIPLAPEQSVYVLTEDGSKTGFFVGVRPATAEEAQRLDIMEGDTVADVDSYESPEDFTAGKLTRLTAGIADVLPAMSAERLAELPRPEADAGAAAADGEEPSGSSETAGLQLIIKGMKRGLEDGKPLPDKMPLRKTLVNNGLSNAEAFAAVAEGGPEVLTLLDRVSDAQAHTLFEYALEHGLIEPEALEPEEDAGAESGAAAAEPEGK